MAKETKPKKDTEKKESKPEPKEAEITKDAQKEIESQYKKEMDAKKEAQKKPLEARDLVNWFKFYILPVVSVLILLVILVAGVYPNVISLFAGLDEISKLEEESSEVQTRITDLQGLSSAEARNNAYLDLIEEIVPTGKTEVVNFQEKIKKIGTDNALTLLESKGGETIVIPDEDEGPSLGLIEIPSQFTFQGALDDIKAFLTELNEGEDFLVINEMKLSNISSVSQDQWTLDITFVKYQFQEITSEQEKLFSQISEKTKPMEEVLRFIQEKYGDGDPLLELPSENSQ